MRFSSTPRLKEPPPTMVGESGECGPETKPPGILPLGEPLRGRIERLVQGRRYAFARLEDGRSVYVHWSTLRRIRFSELRPRQSVRCWLEIGSIGVQAVRVEPCHQRRQRKKRGTRGQETDEKAAA